MTNLEIFKTKQEYNKWLKELTAIQKLLIMEMMDEAMELGFQQGAVETQNDATREIAENYHPNR